MDAQLHTEDIVKADLVFAVKDNPQHTNEKPYHIRFDPPNGFPRTNMQYELARHIDINDLRKRDFKLQRDGVEIVGLRSSLGYDDFSASQKVERVYLSEVAGLLRRLLNTPDVYIVEWLLRRRHKESSETSGLSDEDVQPSIVAHVDYTEADVIQRIKETFGEKADGLLKRRCIGVNVWKPLKGPLRDWPLALCDPATIDFEQDLVAVDELSRQHAFEIYHVRYNPAQDWYYVKDQEDWEATVFVQHDTTFSTPRCVPHCSFALGGETQADPRESVEVRALAFI